MRKTAQSLTKGFTLVELLVVIAIIAILAAIVVLVINPVEIQRRGRDATRLSDLATLQSGIALALQENSETAWYLCNSAPPVPPATTCSGVSTDPNASLANGTGWVKVNLAGQPEIRLSSLPVDPIQPNVAPFVYSYRADADDWEINANLESTEYTGKEGTDGGNSATLFEVGSSLTLI